MPPAHRIEDLERPRLPWPARAANRLPGPIAKRWLSLDPEGLLDAARRRTGLDHFGDDGFREPLGVLLASLDAAALSPLGRFTVQRLCLQLLSNRLLIEATIREHPEVLDERIDRPIVIAGLPRSGTTHLHNLMAQDPALRSLSYWESLEPVPPEAEQAGGGRPDRRIARCRRGLAFQERLLPLFPLMHEMTPEAAHEEIQLLAIDFSTMLFETFGLLLSYRDWYQGHDQTGPYRYLKRILKLLQWLRGPRRWVLKSPQHLEQIGPLLSVFPDARVIQTHRDPVRITASFCTLVTYGMRVNFARPDPEAVGRYWSQRIEDLLRGSVDDRHLLPASQVADVHFGDFMKDDLGTVERLYEFAGLPFDAAASERMHAFVDSHQRGRFGTIRYVLEDFGLDAAERRSALRFYQDRFDVPDEPEGR